MVSRTCLLLCASLNLAAARLLHSLPEDPHAFPKFRVSFMNGQSIGKETAERWLREGLRGGELEFTEQSWQEDSGSWHERIPRKEIGGTDAGQAPSELHRPENNHTLELMRMGPESYLCYIPRPLEYEPPEGADAADAELTPARSWQLLQPLTGTCLYVRWFTYSYCHGQQIRQFKELIPSQPHAATGYRPAEDPEWDAYTLGRAPPTPEPGADLTVAEQNALVANLELAKNAGSRYLVQRWGDGTHCDKTGKPREVEVQFHCSMAMTDTILFVKEAKTCSYVLVIHTPRLCGEPGFKSRRDAREEAVIRCREVVDTPAPSAADLPQGDHPFKHPRRKTALPARTAPRKEEQAQQKKVAAESAYSDILRRALNAFLGADAGNDAAVIVEDGDVVIEDMDDAESNAVITEALRAAGFAIKGDKFVQAEEGEEEYDDPHRDEL
ncbi:hypothetical protein BD626DRAFT_500888 [Schizophyllum amplum]|uniref:Protein OS-9 homolog n=1 Tax=Schizophyllum amplum TaxID=97359 RepID=A0A550CAS4_9AGAR|nr:hypothetical protein BD626DRAFT_500888 [Auriculariopsis ampla]